MAIIDYGKNNITCQYNNENRIIIIQLFYNTLE